MRTSENSSPASAIGVRRGAAVTASCNTEAVASAIDGQPNVAPIRAASARAAPSASWSSIRSQSAPDSAAESPNPTSRPAPDESMSLAYQYGVDTTAQPAASANVSAPEELCSRLMYGVTKTSVAARRSASWSTARKRSSSWTCSLEPEVEDPPLEHQPVFLALAAGDLRMGAAGDHVQHFGVALDDGG